MVRLVGDGYRLSPPPGCPKAIYTLMTNCWSVVQYLHLCSKGGWPTLPHLLVWYIEAPIDTLTLTLLLHTKIQLANLKTVGISNIPETQLQSSTGDLVPEILQLYKYLSSEKDCSSRQARSS